MQKRSSLEEAIKCEAILTASFPFHLGCGPFFDAEKIVFRKKEFDKLYKRDRHHKLFPEDFFVEVYADVSGVMMANPLRKKKLDSHVVEEIVV